MGITPTTRRLSDALETVYVDVPTAYKRLSDDFSTTWAAVDPGCALVAGRVGALHAGAHLVSQGVETSSRAFTMSIYYGRTRSDRRHGRRGPWDGAERTAESARIAIAALPPDIWG